VTVQAGTAIAETSKAAPPPARRPFRLGVGKWGLGVYAVLAFVFLLIPIVYTIVFSFNQVRRSNIAWRGFTLDNWINICDQQEVCEAFGNSILVGVVATLLATALGTAMAIALVRYRFRFRAATTLLLFLPMATPEVVLGAGLAAQFLAAGVSKGIVTIILAHTMFCISFVVVTVRARVASLDPALEEAGRDLYASPAQVFWRIVAAARYHRGGAAVGRAELRRLHHHQLQLRCGGHVPEVHLHGGDARHPGAGERHRLCRLPHRHHRRDHRPGGGRHPAKAARSEHLTSACG
jgi:spermidine/putrescine transport system permease protein